MCRHNCTRFVYFSQMKIAKSPIFHRISCAIKYFECIGKCVLNILNAFRTASSIANYDEYSVVADAFMHVNCHLTGCWQFCATQPNTWTCNIQMNNKYKFIISWILPNHFVRFNRTFHCWPFTGEGILHGFQSNTSNLLQTTMVLTVTAINSKSHDGWCVRFSVWFDCAFFEMNTYSHG